MQGQAMNSKARFEVNGSWAPDALIGVAPMAPPDHMSVQMAINLIANDVRQLRDEIVELRGKLSPILRETNESNGSIVGTMPTLCSMAAELSDIESVIQDARQIVTRLELAIDL